MVHIDVKPQNILVRVVDANGNAGGKEGSMGKEGESHTVTKSGSKTGSNPVRLHFLLADFGLTDPEEKVKADGIRRGRDGRTGTGTLCYFPPSARESCVQRKPWLETKERDIWVGRRGI
jgi:hypothetical protein